MSALDASACSLRSQNHKCATEENMSNLRSLGQAEQIIWRIGWDVPVGGSGVGGDGTGMALNVGSSTELHPATGKSRSISARRVCAAPGQGERAVFVMVVLPIQTTERRAKTTITIIPQNYVFVRADAAAVRLYFCARSPCLFDVSAYQGSQKCTKSSQAVHPQANFNERDTLPQRQAIDALALKCYNLCQIRPTRAE